MSHKIADPDIVSVFHESKPDNRTTKKIVFHQGAPYEKYGAVCV